MEANPINRDYNTISPSAKSLLLMKGYTRIPFAKRAAGLISFPEKYTPDPGNKDFSFWARVAHFENRYWSIDQLLSGLSINNILELSSGFSFRGLQAVKEKDIHYIDTDLPDIIEQKKKFLVELQNGVYLQGKLEMLPLNALDGKRFLETTDRFPDGKMAIVNEGLLVYLNTEEKEKLCSIIHQVLVQRGGYWITADIYIKGKPGLDIRLNDKLQAFLDQHRIEDNKFESLEAAEAFFNRCGFVVDKEAEPDYGRLESAAHLLKLASPEQINRMAAMGKIHATWRLKVKADS